MSVPAIDPARGALIAAELKLLAQALPGTATLGAADGRGRDPAGPTGESTLSSSNSLRSPEEAHRVDEPAVLARSDDGVAPSGVHRSISDVGDAIALSPRAIVLQQAAVPEAIVRRIDALLPQLAQSLVARSGAPSDRPGDTAAPVMERPVLPRPAAPEVAVRQAQHLPLDRLAELGRPDTEAIVPLARAIGAAARELSDGRHGMSKDAVDMVQPGVMQSLDGAAALLQQASPEPAAASAFGFLGAPAPTPIEAAKRDVRRAARLWSPLAARAGSSTPPALPIGLLGAALTALLLWLAAGFWIAACAVVTVAACMFATIRLMRAAGGVRLANRV